MKTDPYGQIVLNAEDVADLLMQGQEIHNLKRITVDDSVNIETMAHFVENVPDFVPYTFPHDNDIAVPDYDALLQRKWHMPPEYFDLDIAEHILSLCKSESELQRVGEELLLYQERNMFDLLRYLKYLVDTLTAHRVIWGVGRGSSVASYVLYLLGVHRIDSMFYDLNPREFLR